MRVDVKFDLPTEVVDDFGNDAVESLADSFKQVREDLALEHEGKADRDTILLIAEAGQRSVLQVLDEEKGTLVFNVDDEDVDGGKLVITMSGGLANAFFGQINS